MSRYRQMVHIVVMLIILMGAFIFLSLLLSGCDDPSQDRSKLQPDGHDEATKVVVWRNADQVPNVVTFCADGLAWASTLSSNGFKDPALTRLPEKDSRCAK